MKTQLIAMGKQANGYFGDWTPGAFVFDPESRKTLFVWSGGFFDSGLPICIDAHEASWLLAQYVRIHRLPINL